MSKHAYYMAKWKTNIYKKFEKNLVTKDSILKLETQDSLHQ